MRMRILGLGLVMALCVLLGQWAGPANATTHIVSLGQSGVAVTGRNQEMTPDGRFIV